VNECEHRLEIRDHFRIEALRREFSDATDFYDRNWLIVRFSAKDAVSKVGVCGPYLLTSELRSLLDGARDLTAGRISQFTLPTIEPILRLSSEKRDGSEDFVASVTIHSEMCPPGGPGSSRSIHKYEFGIDRADLQALQRQLEAVLDAYPVIGQP
jgi:hypothetical protein